jgi:hypothetical protein
MVMTKSEESIQRFDRLKGDRGNWEHHWQEIADFVYPRRADFTTKRAEGEKRMNRVFDTSAIQANELLASGLMGMMVNPAAKWFSLAINDPALSEDQEVKEWLSEATDIMFAEMNKPEAGFNTGMHETFLEYGSFGTASILIQEGKNANGLFFQSRPLSELVVAEGEQGTIDTVFRRFQWTVKQMIEKWGEKAVSPEVFKLWRDKKSDQKRWITHEISPRTKRNEKSKLATEMAWMSLYTENATKHTLEESGFEEWPIPTGRFYKAPMEAYGRSPAMTALPDVKMINEIMKVTIKAAQKSVDPAILVPNDGVLNPLRTVPGGVNVFDSSSMTVADIGQLPSANPGIGLDFVAQLSERIRSIFFVDQLQFAGGPQMTATEVLQRTEEKLRLMGPILGRVQTELLGPIIDRTFAILGRQGKFSAAPDILQGQTIEIVYVSPIAQAQRQQEANGFLRAQEVLIGLTNFNPDLLDNLDQDKVFRDFVQLFGVSPDKLRPPQERDDIREQRNQQRAQQQTIEALQQGGEALQSIKAGTAPAE